MAAGGLEWSMLGRRSTTLVLFPIFLIEQQGVPMIAQAEQATIPNQTDPSPEQITQACRKIQKTWSAKERRKRAGGLVSPRWTTPIYPESTFSEQMNA